MHINDHPLRYSRLVVEISETLYERIFHKQLLDNGHVVEIAIQLAEKIIGKNLGDPK